jgi:uncharacterized membrane protein YbhN (UPF0104 family)
MPTTTQPTSALPAIDPRALARRAALPAALAALAAVAIVVAGGPLQAFVDALGRALDADPRWVGAAAVLELLSFGGYIALLWLVGSRASPRMGARESAHVTLGGTAATRLLPTGGAGGAALTLRVSRRRAARGRPLGPCVRRPPCTRPPTGPTRKRRRAARACRAAVPRPSRRPAASS